MDLNEVKKSKLSVEVAPQNSPTSTLKLKSDAIFKAISDRINENVEKAKSVNGIFLYNITKNNEIVKKWSKLVFILILDNFKTKCLLLIFPNAAIDLKSAKLYDGPPKELNVDTTLTVSDDDFVDIALGKINPQVAFMKGKLKISGNIMLTQKLVPLLKTGAKL